MSNASGCCRVVGESSSPARISLLVRPAVSRKSLASGVDRGRASIGARSPQRRDGPRAVLYLLGSPVPSSPEDLRMTRPIATALALACALAAPLAAQKPLITPKDYGKWETLGGARLSPKGDWIAA